ncbi:LytTR family DNA-binding domain-containing protein [Pseudooceanicola sp.]|uniref:LytTR family DNA-binding domain-containing protein n=1 Tax=Pseudooceanicola sp. TaxID=1914328 RepID=UPI0035C6CB6C
MNEQPLQITKREMQRLASSRAVWIGLVAAGVILGLAGPFGTAGALPVPALMVYWITVAAIGFFLGTGVATLTAESLRAWNAPRWPSVLLAGAATGLVNLLALLLINWLVFRLSPTNAAYFWAIAPNVVIISMIISAAFVAIEDHLNARDTPGAPPRILDRLPLEKRGALISLSVQDHYVEVATNKGSELILLRLSDAMAEVGDTPGLQVHRSHWVALKAVRAARRDGARAILTLSNGTEIPVSRTYLPAIREAGLLKS